MDDELEKKKPSIQADNQSIAIGEINIRGTVTGNITIGSPAEPAMDARLRHDLGILLKNVETTWIKGVLEKSVHEAALLELGLELREEAIDNPWRMVMEAPDQSRETLPQGRRIKDIFDEANRLLLILGEPGSGKTTTLLQLARDLIAEVDSAFTQPVPVILNLSTWTIKQQPLDEWLVAELNSKYRLPKKDGQRWLKERRILPLLDGLDEVRAENRAACVEKINQLVVDYGLQGLAVCSRIKDYTALNVRLAFYRAIYIQPLTPEQVDEYLERAGEVLASLRETLQADEALRNMAQSPLILNIMSLAYQNTSAEDLNDPALSTDKARRKHLFDTYIARMFKRKAGSEYDNNQTKKHLSWLARNMQKHNQEVFLIEGLQPSWLPTRRLQWLYVLVSRLNFGIISGLLTGVIFAVIFMFVRDFTGLELVNALSRVVGILLLIGLAVGFIDVLRFDWFSKYILMREFPPILWSVANVTVLSLSIGLILGAMSGIDPGARLSFALIVGLIFGLRGSRQSMKNDIQTIEALRWSWRKALGGAWIGVLLGGLTAGSIGILSTGQNMRQIWTGWAVPGGLLGATIGIIFRGLSSEIIETKSMPNQGIRLSINNALLSGLIVGSVVGLIPVFEFWLQEGWSYIPTDGLYSGLFLGLISALIGALWYGGFDVIQHYILRLILIIQGHTPVNYSRFLDYTVDRIFLQRVGGGYRFIHRLLLEHFAEMGEAK